LATTIAKASERVIADPPGLEREGEVRRLAQVVLAANTERVLPFFSEKATQDTRPRTQACDEAEHKVFPRPPYIRRARSRPTTPRLQKRTSLMEWLAKLGSSGACISGAEHRTCSAGNRKRMSDLPGTPPSRMETACALVWPTTV